MGLLEIALAATDFTVNNLRNELSASPEGQSFLRHWDTMTTLMAIYSVGRVVKEIPNVYRKLKDLYLKLKASKKLKPDAEKMLDSKMEEIISSEKKVRKQLLPDISDLKNARWGKPRGGGGKPEDRAYARKVTGTNQSLYINDVEFDGYRASDKVLLDAKHAADQNSWYDISSGDTFTQDVKIPKIMEQAERQFGVLKESGANSIEWHFSNENVVKMIRKLFRSRGMNIIVIYTPK